MNIFRTKSIAEYKADAHQSHLKRAMGSLDVTLLGIGVIVGTGIFVLTGVAAAKYAGPALMLSRARVLCRRQCRRGRLVRLRRRPPQDRRHRAADRLDKRAG